MTHQTTYRLIMFTLGIIFIGITVMGVIKGSKNYPSADILTDDTYNGYMQGSGYVHSELKPLK